MAHFIPLSIPNITGNELKYVTEAVQTQWVSTAGGSITEFEERFAAYLQVKQACACQSGTAALHLCLRHFGIGSGDIVLVPTLTFIATVNPILYQGAVPVFFDCDEHMCASVGQIRRYIEARCSFDGEKLVQTDCGRQVKAIIPVHVFGDVCDMDALMELAAQYRLFVIEDAAEALGTTFPTGGYHGRAAGTAGHAGAFSFNGNKIITTGGGGMVVSNDPEAVAHMKYLSQQAKDDEVYFVHEEYGYNYRMTNLQAALGLGQLERLDEFIAAKQKNLALYQALLKDHPLGYMQPFHAGKHANCWFYSFVLYEPSAPVRDRLLRYLSENQVQARPIWKLNHMQTPFQKYLSMGAVRAQRFYDSVLNLPCSTNLSEEDVRRVCALLWQFE